MQKNLSVLFSGRRKYLWNWDLPSFSSTFFARVFCTKVLFCQNVSWEKCFVRNFGAKNALSYEKRARITLMKLRPGQFFFVENPFWPCKFPCCSSVRPIFFSILPVFCCCCLNRNCLKVKLDAQQLFNSCGIQFLCLEVVHKWRHAIIYNIGHRLPILSCFYFYQGLSNGVTNYFSHSLEALTLFMNDHKTL